MKATETLLNAKLANTCKVEEEKLKNPIIKIIGIDNLNKMEDAQLENDINTRNFSNLNTRGKLLHSTYNKLNDKTTVVMEVSAEIHKVIRENRDRLFVGYQNCRVHDVINVKPYCFNCARYGHNGFKCSNLAVCLKCAGNHLTKNCNGTNPLCCPNCKFSNENYGKKYSTAHAATDSDMCDILKSKIRLHTDTTDYYIKPYLPRHFGKIDFSEESKRINRYTNKLRSATNKGSSDSTLSLNRTRRESSSSIS